MHENFAAGGNFKKINFAIGGNFGYIFRPQYDHNNLDTPNMLEKQTTLQLTIDRELCKDDTKFGVYSTISDPVFLGKWCWGVNDKFFRLLVVHRCRLHLNCVVTIAE